MRTVCSQRPPDLPGMPVPKTCINKQGQYTKHSALVAKVLFNSLSRAWYPARWPKHICQRLQRCEQDWRKMWRADAGGGGSNDGGQSQGGELALIPGKVLPHKHERLDMSKEGTQYEQFRWTQDRRIP
jgi:hypothetical protein